MAKKGSSKSQQARYAEYANAGKAQSNREKRLKRHIKNHPEDSQAAKALHIGIASYRRYSSKNGVWNATNRYYAQLYTKAGLNGNDSLPKKEPNKTR